jgi:hypothetical protein
LKAKEKSMFLASKLQKRLLSLLFLGMFLSACQLTGPIRLGPPGPPAVRSPTLYVAHDGSDENDCRAIASPCLTIQAAVDKASSGEVIEISGSSYRYEDTIRLDKDQTLQGAEYGSYLSAVVINTFDTIIEVIGEARVVMRNLDLRGSSYGSRSQVGSGLVVGEDAQVTLIDSSISGKHGGIVNSGMLEMFNVTVRDNYSDHHGGGIWNVGTGMIRIHNGRIVGNEAHIGGGISHSSLGTLEIYGTEIDHNQAWRGGGINNGGTMRLYSVAMWDNSARHGITAGVGGGIYNGFGGTLRIEYGRISSNHAPGHGGGISNSGILSIDSATIAHNSAEKDGGGISSYEATTTLINTRVHYNNAGDFGKGGGIAHRGGRLQVVEDSSIHGNLAWIGGGISGERHDDSDVIRVIGSRILGNYARVGGGIATREVSLVVERSHIFHNIAYGEIGGGIRNLYGRARLVNVSMGYNEGQGILNDNGETSIYSSTIYGNSPQAVYNLYGTVYFRDTIVGTESGGNNCVSRGGSIFSMGYNLEDDDTCGFHSTGDQINIESLSLGISYEQGTTVFTILGDSPAIDRGSPICSEPPENWPETDQRSVARPIDGDGDGIAICDIGAYEYEAISSAAEPLIYVPCGDGICNADYEDSLSCPEDCGLPVVPEVITPMSTETPPSLPATPTKLVISDRVCAGQTYSDGQTVATLGANATGYTDNPPGSGPYTYSVEAFNAAGTSEMPTVEEEGCIF